MLKNESESVPIGPPTGPKTDTPGHEIKKHDEAAGDETPHEITQTDMRTSGVPSLDEKAFGEGHFDDKELDGIQSGGGELPGARELDVPNITDRARGDAGDHLLRRATRGHIPDCGKISTARLLALAIAAVAICSVIPAVLDIISHLRAIDSPGVARWALLLLWIGLIQIAYAIYVAQMPDWSSVFVVTVASTATATGYAATLSLTILSAADSDTITFLGLADHLANGHAAAWCFMMLCVAMLQSYFCGRIGIRWKKGSVGY